MEHHVADSFGHWSEICSRSFVPLLACPRTLTTSADDDFTAHITTRHLGPVRLAHVSSGASRIVRSGRLIAAEPREDVLLSLQIAGAGTVTQSGRQAHLSPSQAALYESDRPYELRFDRPMSEYVIQAPRSLVRIAPAAARRSTAIPVAGRSTAVLRHVVQELLTAEESLDAVQDEMYAHIVLELLADGIRTLDDAAAEGALSGESLVASAQAIMERDSADPRLTIEGVARRLGISRRSLEKLFADHGSTTPAAHLRRPRIRRAERLLVRSDATIAAIAHAAGFSDERTFYRAFRRCHDMSPHEWRARQGAPMKTRRL
ncbi:helix-turn-helix domain-containing protein [Nesterenkonia sp. PF2B19]|uniref:helix-turn-helix domain-containing protein n=1 Tax=Nesterenkonia sp. PF2B19 TaxID=1881858 RepID=UPI00087201FF|nr:helix-turn-helix domain-containing protein [Nesterenkonia sp. PF2B19]OSM42280.1 hypothetical protein BCY76_015395 [Nesterenkonia sp. PF2B19]